MGQLSVVTLWVNRLDKLEAVSEFTHNITDLSSVPCHNRSHGLQPLMAFLVALLINFTKLKTYLHVKELSHCSLSHDGQKITFKLKET